MGRKKLDRPHILAAPLAAMLLLGCVCLLIGSAWARYRYQQTTDLLFAPETASQVYLFGAQKNGSFTPMSESLTETANGQKLDFVVTNGESKTQFSPEDQYVQVRLHASLSLGNGDNLSAVLTVGDTTYTAVMRQLDAGSPICESFGEGWVYCFLDANGQELRWHLEGGKLSTVKMTLHVDAQTGLDSSLLHLVASGQPY